MAAGHLVTSSMEDYIETILQLLIEKKGVKAVDIAARMEVSKPSVTGALRVLSKEGLVNYEPYDVISLTPEGEKLARNVLRRHEILRRFLSDVLALPARDIEATACSMEHALTSAVTDRMASLMDRMASCPAAKAPCVLWGNRNSGRAS